MFLIWLAFLLPFTLVYGGSFLPDLLARVRWQNSILLRTKRETPKREFFRTFNPFKPSIRPPQFVSKEALKEMRVYWKKNGHTGVSE